MAANAKVIFDITANATGLDKELKKAEVSAGKLATGLAATGAGVAILGGIGKAAIEMSMDYEKSFAMVSTLMDTSAEDTSRLKTETRQLGATYGFAAVESADAMYQMLSAGVAVADSQELMAAAMKTSVASGAGLTDVVDLTTTALNAYQLEGKDAAGVMNMFVETQNAGKTTVAELAGSLGKVLPISAAFGTSLGDVSAAMATMTAGGIGTAESATMLKAMMNELGKSGTKVADILQQQTGKSFQQLNAEGVPLGQTLGILEDYANQNGLTFTDLFGSVEAATGAMALGGANAETYASTLARLTDANMEVDSSFEKMAATGAFSASVFKEQMAGAFISLGDTIMTVAGPALAFFGEHADVVAPIIVGLGVALGAAALAFGVFSIATSGAMVAFVAALAPVAVAIGGFMVAATPFIAVGAAVAAGVWLAHEALTAVPEPVDLFATSLASSVEPMNATASAMNGLAGSTESVNDNFMGLGVSAKEFNDTYATAFPESVATVGVAVDELGNKITTTKVVISDATKQAVGDFKTMSDDTSAAITSMWTGHTAITDASTADIVGKVNAMADKVIAGYERQRRDAIDNVRQMAAGVEGITAEHVQAVEAEINESYDRKIADASNNAAKQTEIMQKLNAGEIEMTDQLWADLQSLNSEGMSQGIQALSANALEQKVLLNNLASNKEGINREMLQDAVRSVNDQKSQTIAAAEEEATNRIRAAEKLRLEGGEAANEMADKAIEAANRQKDETINAAETLADQGLKKLSDGYKDVAKDVDFSTGEVISAWGRMTGKIGGWQPPNKKVTVEIETKYTTVGSPPSGLPGASIPSNALSSIQIPAMATGGVVTGPTFALVGEGQYPEAVVPLSREGINKFAQGVGLTGDGNGPGTSVTNANTFNITSNDPYAVAQQVDAILGRKAYT